MNPIDYSITVMLTSFVGRWPLLDEAALLFSDYSGYLLIFFVIAWALQKREYRFVLLEAFLAIFIARIVVTETIRMFWHRIRPFHELSFSPLITKLSELPDFILNLPLLNMLIQPSANSSFPSGHAAFYFTLSTVVFIHSKRLGILFFAVSIIMGIARVYGGVHWASDILGGALIGILFGYLMVWVFRKIQGPRVTV